MTVKRDYYEILMVERTATGEEIKKSYRKLALQYHPDRNPGNPEAEEKFKEATEAYEILSHTEKRERYDRFGHAGVARGAAAAGGFDFEFNLHDAMRAFMRDFGDMFGGGFAEGGGASGKGSDRQIRFRIGLAEAAEGLTKKLRIRRMVSCPACSGHGGKGGAEPVRCTTCEGQGRVRRVQRSFFGQFVNVGPCPTCGGSGTTVTDPCPECGGEGRKEGEAEVAVEVPAGVDTGDYLTVRGEGDAGARGGPAGSLVVVFEVDMPEGFERHGQDLLVELPLSPARAALGGKLTVPTLDGTATLAVPAGVQHETLLRLKNKGMPSLRGFGRGHQYVRVKIDIPQKLSGKQRKLYEQLLDLEPEAGDQ